MMQKKIKFSLPCSSFSSFCACCSSLAARLYSFLLLVSSCSSLLCRSPPLRLLLPLPSPAFFSVIHFSTNNIRFSLNNNNIMIFSDVHGFVLGGSWVTYDLVHC